MLAAFLAGCAPLDAGAWVVAKRARLVDCQRRTDLTTRRAAERCMGPYAAHHGSAVCVDTAAWATRIELGIIEAP